LRIEIASGGLSIRNPQSEIGKRMLGKIRTLQKIVESGLVAVIRAETAEQAIQLVEACQKGGVGAIEVTFTVHGAEEVIREITRRNPNGEFVLGAGTVLDPETARIAMLAGAQYMVTPALNEATVRICNRYQIPCIPGAMTVREVLHAMECGADIIKLFPGELFGPEAIRAIRGPLPQANLLPTGGVNLDNVSDWIAAGAVGVAAGGALTGVAKTGGMKAVTETARKFIEKIRAARTHK
jgi:2-dehydro-3-deoxyphosphogluconate aldolase/(4S)-4-hydroxy-2-oxoglutarate aldolase